MKKAAKITPPERTFEAVARAWHKQMAPTWSAQHAGNVIDSLASGIFPVLGAKDVAEITPAMALASLRTIEGRGAIETAHRVRQRMSMVFVFAIASGLAEQDPAHVVTAALAPVVKGRQPAIVDLAEARGILAAVDSKPAFPVTKLALRLLALTALRPGELRGAMWEEFVLTGPEPTWFVPGPRMKMKKPHVVPLSIQAIEVLKVLQKLTGQGALVFPSSRSAHHSITENAIGYLLNRAGYHGRHVPHGWRATFSTVMNERYRADREVIDLMLAHAPKDKTEAAYNRAMHMPRRRDLAQAWADLIMEGMASAESLTKGQRRSSPDSGLD